MSFSLNFKTDCVKKEHLRNLRLIKYTEKN